VHGAVEFFKKRLMDLILKKAIKGHTANNMITFMGMMTNTLRATFKEQISFESALCREYLEKIDKADKSKSFNPSTRGVKEASFKTYEAPPSDGIIMLENAAVQECMAELRSGPLLDIMNYIACVEHIALNESMGAVKDQNMVVRDSAVIFLRDLLEIFTAFMTSAENAMAALQEADASIARTLANRTMPNFINPPAFPLR
jgi:hypothetical protein